jgi:hypothetical protein
LWENNQFSPIWRNAKIEIQLCEADEAHRNLNPTRFDRNHRLLGRLFRDPNFFSYALHLYNLDPGRFVHYHHHLIPVIRGCAMVMQMQPVHGTTSPETLEVHPVPAAQNIISPPPAPSAVPAPPSIILIALGMSYVAARARFRRGAVSR